MIFKIIIIIKINIFIIYFSLTTVHKPFKMKDHKCPLIDWMRFFHIYYIR